MSDALIPFVQLDLPGRLGIADGRYLAAADDGQAVLVVLTLGAPAPTRHPLRRPKPRPASDPEPAEVPVTRLTAVGPGRLDGQAAARSWLAEVAADDQRVDAELRSALELINRALHAQRTGSGDPHIPDASAQHALAVRIGWGTGNQVADSAWTDAVEIPPEARRVRRLDQIRPQERIAAVLGRGERVDACEAMLLRARADLDAGRLREGALQLRVGLEALLAEVVPEAGPEQADDLAELEERQVGVAAAAHEALRGDLSEDGAREVEETLRVGERVLRRRRLLERG